MEEQYGRKQLCATPIGNLEDMTFRAVRTLNEVDLIAAEDTRNSIKLLNHFSIHTPMTSYHEFNKIEKARELVAKMLEGKTIALITDAGTPGISDPGEDSVRLSMEAGIEVTSLPGACACVNALILSGLPTRRFCFEAFLPTDKKERKKILEELQTETRTCVLYEAPHRLVRTLEELYDVLGERRLTLCRELTKKHETVFPATLSKALAYYRENEPRGECVIVLEGRSRREMEREQQEEFQALDITAHLEQYLDKGMEKKEAMKAVARDRGIGKREVYQLLLEAQESQEKDV